MRHSSRQRKYGHHVGISAGLAAAVLSTAPGTVAAQSAEQSEEKTPAASPEVVESIVVTGTRASLKSALDRKRAAGTVSDSIVAEDIAQFPDKNIGEALSRVTGVQLSREFGEGHDLDPRSAAGSEPRRDQRQSVLHASGPGGSRAARLSRFCLRAHQDGRRHQGLHRRPHGRRHRRHGSNRAAQAARAQRPAVLVVRTAAGTVAPMGGWTPRANITAATQFFDDRFGIMANVTYDQVNTRQDYLRNTEWVRLGDWDESADKTIESLNPLYAAQTTEAGCDTAFTVRPTADLCRQQWWDYSPRIPRYGIWLSRRQAHLRRRSRCSSRSTTSRTCGWKSRAPSAISSSTTTTTAPTSPT